MIHKTRDKSHFIHFAHTLENYYETHKDQFSSDLHKVKRVITDDDKSIRDGFQLVFNSCSFLLCCNHLKKDIHKVGLCLVVYK